MGVSMSTFLSSPFALFFTFTLHPGKVPNPASARTTAPHLASGRFVRIMTFSLSDLTAAFDSRAAFGDIWNADRKTPVNWDLTKERFYRAHFRNGRIRKRTQIIL